MSPGQECITGLNYEKLSKYRYNLQNDRIVVFKNAKVTEIQARQKDLPRMEETKGPG